MNRLKFSVSWLRRNAALSGLGVLLAAAAPCAAADAGGYDVVGFGASGRDVRTDTAAIQRAIDACAKNGGGRVTVPDGFHATVASIELRSHVELYLGRGAVLLASPHHADFTKFSSWPISFPGEPAPRSGVVVYAEDATDVALTGPGTIDGNSDAYISERGTEIHKCPNNRPFPVVFFRCTRVTVRDVVLAHSANWTLKLMGCDDGLIDAIRIQGDMLIPNNDGIDIDWSSNVRIRGCHIVTGDDCISLKTTPENLGLNRPCENIVVTNCTLVSRSAGIAVGCDVNGTIRDAVFSDCVIKDSHRGVAVRLSTNGSIERIQFNNMSIETRRFDSRWWGAGEPIQVLAMPWNKDYHNGVIRDVRFNNLVCRGENGAVIVSNEPGHIQGIEFDHVSLLIDKTTAYDGGYQDFRPNEIEPMPRLPVSGVLLRHAAGVTFRDCTVTWGANRPAYYGSAVDAADCPGLKVDGLAGEAAHSGEAARVIR